MTAEFKYEVFLIHSAKDKKIVRAVAKPLEFHRRTLKPTS